MFSSEKRQPDKRSQKALMALCIADIISHSPMSGSDRKDSLCKHWMKSQFICKADTLNMVNIRRELFASNSAIKMSRMI